MDTVRWQKLKQIFNEAIELDGEARKSFLEKACGEDSVLRDRVEALLRSDDDSSSFQRGQRHRGSRMYQSTGSNHQAHLRIPGRLEGFG